MLSILHLVLGAVGAAGVERTGAAGAAGVETTGAAGAAVLEAGFRASLFFASF